MTNLSLSVIISTRNRMDFLGFTLGSLIANQTPGFLEILVVDNASNDQTAEVVRDWQKKSPVPIHYVLERKLGLSQARNRGVQEAKGDIVAFIDDDAKAEPDWIAHLLRVFSSKPNFIAGGGRVLLDWGELHQPKWLTKIFFHSLSYYELPYADLTTIQIENDFLIGCNLSCRRKTFLAEGGFDPHLGRVGTSLQEGEDGDLQRKILKSGGDIFYEPKAVVHHMVLPYKITKKFFFRFYWGKALTTLQNYQQETRNGPWKTFFHFLIRIPVWFGRLILHIGQADQRFYCLMQMVLNVRAATFSLKNSAWVLRS